MAKPRQLLTSDLGAVATGTITVVLMAVRATRVVSMVTIVMLAKAMVVTLLPRPALNVKRNSLLVLNITLVAFLVSNHVKPMLSLALQLAVSLC